jgi:beta-galactosidase
MKRFLSVCAVFLFLTAGICLAETYTPETSNRVKINFGATLWKFLRSDPPNAQNPGINDAGWKDVGIPHTWNDTDSYINQKSGGGDGSMYEGTCWYRKHFALDNTYADRKIFVEFEGVHVGCQVYINGTLIPGNSAYNPQATHVLGFIGFIVDLTSTNKLNFGGADNVLAVRVGQGGFLAWPGFSLVFRFGSGDQGIYRPVWMHITDKIHVPSNVYSVVNQWGTYAATLSANGTSASLRILTNVLNESASSQAVSLTTKVVDPSNGTVVLSMAQTQTIAAGANFVFDQKGDASPVQLWYPNNSTSGSPKMYKAYHIVKAGGATVDVFETALGIRTITWDADFPYINGKKHYLWGASGRYDYPALGTAIPDEQVWRDIKLTAGCGGNLWRPGHSAEGPVFAAACDAYGVMQIQPSGDGENNWATDMLAGNTNAAYQIGLKKEIHRDMVIRDRNHPSILAWEASNGACDPALCDQLRSISNTWDSLAPRKLAVRGAPFSPLDLASCTLTGCEIGIKRSQPQCPAWGAEAWGRPSERFAYDYEIQFAGEFLQNWRKSIQANCFGLCQWYLAETPGEDRAFLSGRQPSRSFGSSMLDFNRIPKFLYYAYKACWRPYSIEPVVALAHHWNRSGNVRVNVFSNCPSVRLLINGVSQGTRTPNPWTGTGEGNDQATTQLPFQCSWDVTWAKGTVKAEGLDANGNVVCTDQKVTAGTPHHIVLTVEPPLVKPDGKVFRIKANGSDAAFILATVVDSAGNWCPTDSHFIRFKVSGPGNYRGGTDQFVTEGKPLTYHSPMDSELTAEGGMCKVAIRSMFTPGTVTVTATSSNGELAGGTTSFTVYPFSEEDSSVNTRPANAVAPLSTQSLTIAAVGAAVKYHVSAPSFVSVDIIDASGRIVNHVPNALVARGWHVVPFATSGKNKSSGMYIVRCIVNGRDRFVKRVMLIR